MIKSIKKNRWNEISEDNDIVVKDYINKSRIFTYNKFDDETLIKNQAILSQENPDYVYSIIKYGRDYHISKKETIFNTFEEIDKKQMFELMDNFSKIKPSFEINNVLDYKVLLDLDLPTWTSKLDLKLSDDLFERLKDNQVLNMGDIHMWNMVNTNNGYKFIDLDSIVMAPYWYDYAHMLISTVEMQNKADIELTAKHMGVEPKELVWMCEQVGKLQLLEWIWRDNKEEYLDERDNNFQVSNFLKEMKKWNF